MPTLYKELLFRLYTITLVLPNNYINIYKFVSVCSYVYTYPYIHVTKR